MGTLKAIAWRDRKRGPMREVTSAAVDLETGVAGDFRGKRGARQVTVLSAEVWRSVCDELGAELPWTMRRANLLVEGVELPRRDGAIIDVGDVSLEVTVETDPCSRMDEQHDGLRAALLPDWRGGVCCRVLAGGNIRPGDPVTVRDA